MSEAQGGFAICGTHYTPADPVLKRPDAPGFDCELPPGHTGYHRAEVAPGLLFCWRDGFALLQWTDVIKE